MLRTPFLALVLYTEKNKDVFCLNMHTEIYVQTSVDPDQTATLEVV